MKICSIVTGEETLILGSAAMSYNDVVLCVPAHGLSVFLGSGQIQGEIKFR